jgi:hypothetical protein
VASRFLATLQSQPWCYVSRARNRWGTLLWRRKLKRETSQLYEPVHIMVDKNEGRGTLPVLSELWAFDQGAWSHRPKYRASSTRNTLPKGSRMPTNSGNRSKNYRVSTLAMTQSRTFFPLCRPKIVRRSLRQFQTLYSRVIR